MLRRLLVISALVATLGTAVPRAEAATTATATFTGMLGIWGDVWYVDSSLCTGASFDSSSGADAMCTISAYGPASASCTVLGGAVWGRVTFVHSGTTLDFTGTAIVTHVIGDATIAITGFATNPWTGKVAWFTAAIDTVTNGWACNPRIAYGAFNVTPVI